jgi:3'(2'), 5'-bisphosphate nucleotidase
VPVIGEEAAAAGDLPDLSTSDYFWLVDALDGTREFTEGGLDFTVNIALIHKTEQGGEPILGVVYAPARGALYAGHGPGTATRWLADSDHEKNINVRSTPKAGITVVSSTRSTDTTRMDQFLSGFKVEKIIRRGSSLKICAIAEGKADFYPRFGAICEWDTAAGDAVLRAAGGLITDMNGQPLTYGHAERTFINPECVASAFEWFGVTED